MDYVTKLDQLASEQQTRKQNVRKHKMSQLGLMENIQLYTQPIIDEQVKTRKVLRNTVTAQPLPQLSQKQIEFQDAFHIDFRNIDQNLPKSIRPTFNQDGFKIGKAFIDVNREQRLMRVRGRHTTYQITQDLVDLIKGEPLDNYSESVKADYRNLLEDVDGSRRAKRVKHLSGSPSTPVRGNGFSFLPDNVDSLLARLHKLLAAAMEGHSNVHNEIMAILKRLLELKAITIEQFKHFLRLIKKV